MDTFDNTNISFVFRELFCVPGNAIITALTFWEDFAFAGTNKGELLLYSIHRLLRKVAAEGSKDASVSSGTDTISSKGSPHELLSSISAELIKSGKIPGEKPIENLHAMGCATHDVVIVRNSIGNVYLVDPRELNIICTMPIKNIKNLCCNDGQPYLGLCLNTGSQLLVYDLQKSLEPQKRFTIPESPQKMLWLRGRFCLGFRDEYTLLSEESGDVGELLALDNRVAAVMKLLPSEEYALSATKCVIITDSAGGNPQKLKLMHQPKFFAFTFPYIYSLSENNTLEIRNLHDQHFHEIVKVPTISGSSSSPASANLLADDGRHVFVSVGSHVYFVNPSSYRYQMGDLALFCKIAAKLAQGEHELQQQQQQDSADQDQSEAQAMAPYLDRAALMGYLTGLFGSDKSPWKQLVLKQVYKLAQRFPYPESATLERAKLAVNQFMRCIYRTETAFFSELTSPLARELVYVTTQVIFFAHIYGIVSAILKDKFSESDKQYQEKLRELEQCTIGEMCIRKKFHLNAESLAEDAAKETQKQTAQRRASDASGGSGNAPSTPIRISGKLKTVIEEEKPNAGTIPSETEAPSPVPPDAIPGYSLLGEGKLIESDPLSQNETEMRVQLAYDSDYIMHINKYETTGFEELKLDGQFRFDESTLTVSWIFQGKKNRLIFDEEDIFKQFCLQYQMYESQSLQYLARSTASLGASTNSLGSSPRGLGLSIHRSASSSLFLFGSPRSATSDESTPQQASMMMSSSLESNGTDQMSSSLLSNSSLGSTPVPASPASSSSAVAPDIVSGSAPAAVSATALMFFPSDSPSTAAASSPFSTASSGRSSSLLSRSASSKSKLFDDLDDDDTDEFDEPKTFKAKRRSNSTAKSQQSSSKPANSSPVKRRAAASKEYKLEEDPYCQAIKTLKRLNSYRSPREKVECALKALNQTVQAITSFWKQHKKDIIVGADDLVPIFGYVVLRAAVPAIYFEMNFSMEFATESTLRGKYGYALATLQAAVEYLLTIQAPIEEDEPSISGGDDSAASSTSPRGSRSPSQPVPMKKVVELSETDFLVISHSPLHDEQSHHHRGKLDPAALVEETDESRSKRLSTLISKVDRMHEQKHKDSSETGIDEDLNAAAAATPQKKRTASAAVPIAAKQTASISPASNSSGTPPSSPQSPFFNDTEKIKTKFGIKDEGEAVLEWYTCTATHPTAASGWIYIMKRHICFESAPIPGQQQSNASNRYAVRYGQIAGIRKTWAFLSAGGIEITTKDGKYYFFRNFRERDTAFNALFKAYEQSQAAQAP